MTHLPKAARFSTMQPGPAGDENPETILADMQGRPRPAGRIILIANEKGGVGKSTLAFHLAVALAHAGLRVAALDLDGRQRTLSNALHSRDATARRLGVALPPVAHDVLLQASGAMLCQEMARIGWSSDVIILDGPGHDAAAVRRAIAIADTLVTPVNGSFVDLELLARLHPVSHALLGPGCFARMVDGLRTARAQRAMPPLDWVVVQNRHRGGQSHNQQRIDRALAAMADTLDFRVSPAWPERVAFRELFLMGLTMLDLTLIPGVPKARQATHELAALLATLMPMDAAADDTQIEMFAAPAPAAA